MYLYFSELTYSTLIYIHLRGHNSNLRNNLETYYIFIAHSAVANQQLLELSPMIMQSLLHPNIYPVSAMWFGPNKRYNKKPYRGQIEGSDGVPVPCGDGTAPFIFMMNQQGLQQKLQFLLFEYTNAPL